VRVTDFYARYPSRLVVNGAEYSRNILENQTLVLWSSLVWDGLDGHFQICMEAPPLCPDGFELTPVPVEECPAGAEVLSNCEEAEPGELCEGNGQPPILRSHAARHFAEDHGATCHAATKPAVDLPSF
jgi:hypothetical protein